MAVAPSKICIIHNGVKLGTSVLFQLPPSRGLRHGCTKPLKSRNCTYGFGNPRNLDLFTSIETDSRVGEAWGVRVDALAGVMWKCPAALVVAVWDGVPSG